MHKVLAEEGNATNGMSIITGLIGIINNLLDKLLPIILLASLIGIILRYTLLAFRKQGLAKGIYFSVFFIVEGVLLVIIFWTLPAWLSQATRTPLIATIIRWLLICLTVFGITKAFSNKYGGKRGIYSALWHLGLIFFGWWIDRWIGILLMSLPLIFIYYYLLFHISGAIIPAANPEDFQEVRKRFSILFSYTWGFQGPLLIAPNNTSKDAETRIDGDFVQPLGFPGMIWTHSNQVVGITGGTRFKRVDGPGLVFTGSLERPVEIIDLRTQLRTAIIDAISKDGIPFRAVVFVAFSVDRDPWTNETREQLQNANPLLREGKELDYTEGSFPFSHARVRAVLGMASFRLRSEENDKTFNWDDQVVNQVEEASRQVLSQHNLDELWKPENEEQSNNALDIIAEEIKQIVFVPLLEVGVRIFTARIVNFAFTNSVGEESVITKQQIATWSIDWERKRGVVLADGEAEIERLQLEARAYAHSIFLTSIAEGLEISRSIHPNLPRYVIAMRYIGALEQLIQYEPDVSERNNEQIRNKINDWKHWIMLNSSQE